MVGIFKRQELLTLREHNPENNWQHWVCQTQDEEKQSKNHSIEK
jgi:hypothetical protein